MLFLREDDAIRARGNGVSPEYFRDLNLDQIVASIVAGRETPNLATFFQTLLRDVDAVAYRQEAFQDLENVETLTAIRLFTEGMATARRYSDLAKTLHFDEHKQGWFLASVCAYCDAVEALAEALATTMVSSRSLGGFRSFLTAYAHSVAFQELATTAGRLTRELHAIRYTCTIKGGRVVVRSYRGESDYGAAVEETFERFRRGAVKDYRSLFTRRGMNHVEAHVLERVARLNPSTFNALAAFCDSHTAYADERILAFYYEIQFYLAFLDYVERFRHAGLPFCYPAVAVDADAELAQDAFDPSLAARLLQGETTVVLNDFALHRPERIFVVSGPNQGGKTTFARMFGQLHYLAALGCLVPARRAELLLCDRLLAHFEREEDASTLRGKLEDDLVRIHAILDEATPRSVVIMNEVFSSTTLRDAIALGRRVLEKICELDALCVCVTFLDELALLNAKVVSMVATVDPQNPVLRTFRVVRRPPDGLAYALAIAQKHGVTYPQLRERIKP